ncbi:MAG: efflux RND transporter periplasmic adaptor subunit [Pirellulaceae bacterium]
MHRWNHAIDSHATLHFVLRRSAFWLAIVIFSFGRTVVAQQSDSAVEAFIEPFKTVQIPAPEVGTLRSIDVVEGQSVSQGQTLAHMDDQILQVSLQAATAAKDAVGNLRAAQAELLMKQRQLTSLQTLRQRGNATQRELDRGIADCELSEARLQAVREDLLLRQLEHARIVAQIEKRTLRSPIDGVVAQIDKEAGEFVSPTDPNVMVIVQLDPVQAVFSVPISAVSKIEKGSKVQLTIGVEDRPTQGIVEFIAPTADAQSGTVRVKVQVANHNGRILCGSTCRWDLNSVVQNEFADSPSRRLLMSRLPIPTKQ